MFWPVRHRGSNFLDNFDECNNIFESLYDNIGDVFGSTYYKNEDGDHVIEIDCPGFNKNNLKVEISNGIVSVHGERTYGNNKKKSLSKYIGIGKYENIEASIEDGILALTIKSDVKKKNIEIK